MALKKDGFITRFKNIILDEGEKPDIYRRTTSNQIKLKIFLTSFSILFFELICIRWIPAYVRFLSYFMNFVMLAAFLGIGLGIMASRREKLRLPAFSIWLFFLIIVILAARFELLLPSTQVLYYAAGESIAPPENSIVLPVILFLVVIAFTILARPLGKLLTAIPPLQAYTWDIVGSLAGIAAFFFMSYLSLSPFYWFMILCILVICITPKRRWLSAAPFLIGSLVIVFGLARGSLWSPYYRIQIQDVDDGHYVYVNNVGHQFATHFLNKETFYFRVYDLLGQKPFKKVLVLGAGVGPDVAIALNYGAETVDAVEIDPIIHQLGIELNPDQPYADPRVNMYIDDGRSFLRNVSGRYDLIIFALPDSLTLTSSYSSLRLESFLLTTDAFESAAGLLSEDGMLVLYNYYREEWLVRKLAGMVNHVMGSPPFVTTYGAYGRAAVIMGGPRLAELDASLLAPYSEDIGDIPAGTGWPLPVIGQGTMGEDPTQALASDNWPFIYMPTPAIPSLYLGALSVLLILALSLTAIVVPKETLRRF
ncbi:MAG: hypothetical protein JXR32_04120, partial [Anaerolineaceae bacterium]|nr:hypothetical protein [Anaerolineaceae bacterium]